MSRMPEASTLGWTEGSARHRSQKAGVKGLSVEIWAVLWAGGETCQVCCGVGQGPRVVSRTPTRSRSSSIL